MPVFEYRCEACGKRATLLVGMTQDSPEERCPVCGAAQMRKMVSRFTRGRGEDQRVAEMEQRLTQTTGNESAGELRDLTREMGRAMDEDLSDEMEAMFESDMEDGE